MKIFTIDPGKTTGYAVTEFFDKKQITALTWGQLDCSTIKSRITSIEFINTLIFDKIIIEDFKLRTSQAKEVSMNDGSMATARFIGMLEYNFDNIIWQQPSQKSMITDVILKSFGLWFTPAVENRHAHDAFRHAIVFWRTHAFDNEELKRKGI